MPKPKFPRESLEFGRRLAQLLADNRQPRRGAGAYLAGRYKVSTVTANAWLNGVHKCETDMARRIAEDHGSTFDWLYFGVAPATAQADPRAEGAGDLAAAVSLTLNEILRAVAGHAPQAGRAILGRLDELRQLTHSELQQRVLAGAIASTEAGLASWESEGRRVARPASAGKPPRTGR
jgi:hypothetical protein